MIQITSHNAILLNGHPTGLSMVQRDDKTVIYTPENRSSGQAYVEHNMPFRRYAVSHSHPASGAPGMDRLAKDVSDLLYKLHDDAAEAAQKAASDLLKCAGLAYGLPSEITTDELSIACKAACDTHRAADLAWKVAASCYDSTADKHD